MLYAVLQSWLILARPWRFSSLFSSEELINMPKYGKTNYIIIILSSQAYLNKSFSTQNHKKKNKRLWSQDKKRKNYPSHHICMHDQVHPNNRIRASSILGWWPLWGFSLNYSDKKTEQQIQLTYNPLTGNHFNFTALTRGDIHR